MNKVIDLRRILKKVRRSSIYRSSIDLLGSVFATKDLARDLPRHIERKLRRSPLHPLMMRARNTASQLPRTKVRGLLIEPMASAIGEISKPPVFGS